MFERFFKSWTTHTPVVPAHKDGTPSVDDAAQTLRSEHAAPWLGYREMERQDAKPAPKGFEDLC